MTNRMRFIGLVSYATLAFVLSVAPACADDVIRDLLAMPAPPPGDSGDLEQQLIESATEPAADAPLDQLAGYWAQNDPKAKPSDAVRERLVEAIEKRPDLLSMLVKRLPVREDVCARVKRSNVDHGYVDAWLLQNCRSELDKLAAAAARAQDAERGGYVEGEDNIVALARADWKRAEPLLRQLAGSTEPRTRALALALLYEQAPSDELRSALRTIAADVTAPARARDYAIATLGRSDWQGRDEWLLKTMADASLLDFRDGMYSLSPIESIAASDPGRWIPFMAALLGHSDSTVHSLAAKSLGQFDRQKGPRADALRPLLPWISDPNWVAGRGMHRLRIVQAVAQLDLREAIPHLLRVVADDAEPDHAVRVYAAAALADFGDTTAADAIRKAVRSADGHSRHVLIEAAVRTNVFTPAELARGLEAFVAQGGWKRGLFTPGPLDVALGTHVYYKAQRDDIAAAVIARAAELRAEKPELANELLGIVAQWEVPSADALVIGAIEDGSADATKLSAALRRRESFRVSVPDALKRLAAAGGTRSAIAAVVSGDVAAQRRILGGDDRDAQRMLLALARLVREPLPLDVVASLFGRSSELDAAAEAWLIAEDGAAARAIVQKRHPNELLVLGWRLMDGLAEWEKDLVARFLKRKPTK